MNFFEKNRYFTINQRLLTFLGLWPYQNSRVRSILAMIVLASLLSFPVFQITKLITAQLNRFLVLESLSFFIIYLMCTTMYCHHHIKEKEMKNFLEKMKYDWDELKENEEELSIIEKYAYEGRGYTIAHMTYNGMSVIICAIVTAMPPLLDIIAPLNTSRPHGYLPPCEYFIDQDKYFYLIMLHVHETFFVIAMVIIATGAMYIVFVQHICAIFAIAGYRLEHAFDEYSKRISVPDEAYEVRRKIGRFMECHERALEEAKSIDSCYATFMFLLTIMAAISLSANLYQILQASSMKDMFFYVVSSFVHLITILIYCFPGQKLLEHSVTIYKKAYDGYWYLAPAKIQKMLLIVMQRGKEPSLITLGRIYPNSMEFGAFTLEKSFSFFMMLYNLQ